MPKYAVIIPADLAHPVRLELCPAVPTLISRAGCSVWSTA